MSDDTGSIGNDEPFDIETAFLSNLNGGSKSPPEREEKGADVPEQETPADDADTDDSKPETEATEDDATPSPEDAEVTVKVGEEEHKVKVKDLTLLYGQEAALTRKSQEVAQARATADAEALKATTALRGMLDRANARWEPYSKLDFLVLAQQVDADTLTQVRADALAAANDVRFLTEELSGVEKTTRESQQATANAEAQATIKALEHPDTGIKGFGPTLYNEIVGYMVQQGFPEARARSVTAEAAIRMAHKAMMFDRQATSAAAKVEKVVNKATKTMRPGSGHSNQASRSERDALSRLRRSGSREDAADAFLASFRD